MAAMDNPEKVINAIIWVFLHAKEALAVGWKAEGTYLSHHLPPDITERISGNVSHRMQIDTALPPMGTQHQLTSAGTTVEDGVRSGYGERMKTRNAHYNNRLQPAHSRIYWGVRVTRYMPAQFLLMSINEAS